jgi:hypothetical protein
MRILLPFLASIALSSCGSGEKVKIVEVEVPADPQPGPGPGPAPQPGTSWAEMRTLFNENCASCHRNDPFAESETALRASRSEAKIRNRTMPPNQNAMSENDRAKMLNFF